MSSSPATTRDPWFDNAKMALVTLVVLGHSWTLVPQNTVDNWLYDALYLWHVPAFVIITGYLSKSFEHTPRRLWSLVTTVAVPYVVFEALLAWFRLEMGGVRLQDLWANPHWPMWYLAALFCWRLLTPVFKRLPAKVVIAVLISLGAGLYAGDTLDVARVLGLLPFFVLGLKMHDGHWAMLRTHRARVYGVVVLVLVVVLARFTDQWIETEWLYYRSRYDVLDHDDVRAITIRMVLLLIGLAGSFAFFALVPRNRSWFSRMGAASLVVYLFHGFVVLGAEYAGYPGWTATHWPFSLVVTTVAALAVALLLAWPPVAKVLNVAVDPIGSLTRWWRQTRRDPVPTSE